MEMFCFQCEETTQGAACVSSGTCGKSPDVAALEDLLLHALKGVSCYASLAAESGARDSVVDEFLCEAMFTTVTNVNFDPASLRVYLLRTRALRERVVRLCGESAQRLPTEDGPWSWEPAEDIAGLVRQGMEVSVSVRVERMGRDVTSLEELLTYGIKGTAAYAYHAARLGRADPEVAAVLHEALAYLAHGGGALAHLVELCLKCGEANLRAMELLDTGNTQAYGHPEPTEVRVEPVAGKAILVSGHDLRDLEELLAQTEGAGINVYTHSEMLPAHAYPGLKRHRHLVGNYGGAWHGQRDEFEAFPGPIVMTSNCIQKPRESYRDRIFTCGPVAWPGTKHIDSHDFSDVIERARSLPGFTDDRAEETILIGFGHDAVLGVAGKVIDAVKSGALKHLFLVGGCDGQKGARSYYTDFARAVPDDCIVLTLGCAKYRFNRQEFGDIGGIPRLLDMGQCNDAYSAIQVASALAEAFDTDLNGLPLTLNISWLEQKAACILLTLLHLGIKNVRLGPTLPAFVSPNILSVLVERFGIGGITSVEDDLSAMLSA